MNQLTCMAGRRSARLALVVSCLAFFTHGGQATALGDEQRPLSLRLRSRVPISDAAGQYQVVERTASWAPEQTAFIVCDMWDLHHCLNAVRRAEEMAPRMDQVLKHARERGVQIIHAPSGCMDTYKDHPARLRVIATPKAGNLPAGIGQWCYKIPSEEQGAYPIDQANGGEDDDPAEHAAWAEKLEKMGRNPKAPWKSQMKGLAIDPDRDLISDQGEEIWSILEARGIKNVVLMGVHLNMCVLGRPFGLRQMAKNGRNVVLMRDLTDTMYDPTQAPFVSHFSGTDLMVEHVEKFVCPSITSDQILGGTPSRFSGDKRPHLVFVIAEDEYRTELSLPAFIAQEKLLHQYHVSYVLDSGEDRNILPGLGILKQADALFVSVRRRVLPEEQVKLLQSFVASGKPVLGIRTASHAFAASAKQAVPGGHVSWTRFDPEVLGGNYQGHHKAGPKVEITRPNGAGEHPILREVNVPKLTGFGSLYKVNPLASTTQVLLMGAISGHAAEPVAWVNTPSNGARVFYTSLGHRDDFALADFNRLLHNAIDWAIGGAESSAAGAR